MTEAKATGPRIAVDDSGERMYDVDLSKLPQAEWEMVTPLMAHEALQHMRANRNLRAARVEAIKHDILARKWRFTGETVQQGDDGLWDNGQHRFTAIYESGVAVPVLVVRGIDEAARLTLDTGTPRRYHDTLKMREDLIGHPLGGAVGLGAVIRRMYMWDVHRAYMLRGGGRASPSHEELENYRLEHLTEIERSLAVREYARRIKVSPTVLSTVSILLRRIDEEGALAFLEGVITGAEMRWDDPRMRLREKLADLHEKGDATPDETRAWIFLAWNHWREGTRLTKLQPPRGGTARQPFTDKNYPLPS